MSDDWRQTQVSPRLAVVVILTFIVVIIIMAGNDNKPSAPNTSESQTPAVSPAPAASRQLGSGDRHAHLRTLLSGSAPLFSRYNEVGPASVNLYLEPSVWNGLTYDQQQQLMDELASKQIVRDIGATLHLYVSSTEVGTIGPGWTGEWAFRGRQH